MGLYVMIERKKHTQRWRSLITTTSKLCLNGLVLYRLFGIFDLDCPVCLEVVGAPTEHGVLNTLILLSMRI